MMRLLNGSELSGRGEWRTGRICSADRRHGAAHPKAKDAAQNTTVVHMW